MILLNCPNSLGTFHFSQIKPVSLCILEANSLASAALGSTGLHLSAFHCALSEKREGLEQNP